MIWKKGDRVYCDGCGAVLYWAERDIHVGDPVRASDFLSADIRLDDPKDGDRFAGPCPDCGSTNLRIP